MQPKSNGVDESMTTARHTKKANKETRQSTRHENSDSLLNVFANENKDLAISFKQRASGDVAE